MPFSLLPFIGIRGAVLVEQKPLVKLLDAARPRKLNLLAALLPQGYLYSAY